MRIIERARNCRKFANSVFIIRSTSEVYEFEFVIAVSLAQPAKHFCHFNGCSSDRLTDGDNLPAVAVLADIIITGNRKWFSMGDRLDDNDDKEEEQMEVGDCTRRDANWMTGREKHLLRAFGG